MAQELVDRMISVVIPCYDEPALPRVVARAREELGRLGRTYEIIVVDDASTLDGASEIPPDPTVRVLRQPVNCGYGASLKEGIRQARGEVVVTLDGDGQHDPADIGSFVELMDKQADAAIGCRRKRFHSSWWRMPGKLLLLGLARYLSRRQIPDVNCGYRAFRTEVIRRYLPLCSDRFSFSTTAMLCVLLDGRKVVFLPLDVEQREGSSTVRPRDGFAALLSVLHIVMLFSPLRVLLPAALLLLALGSASLIRDVVRVDITQGTILLLIGGMLIFFFALLADQISAIRRRLL